MVDNGSFRTSSNLQEVLIPARGGAILSGSAKPGNASRRHIDPASDLKKLDICFGGFSPTLMGDAESTRNMLDMFEARRNEALRLQREASELSRGSMSEERVFRAQDGIEWRYVVIDGAKARIVSTCIPDDSDVTNLHIPDEVDGITIASIGDDACSKLASIESIDMPDAIVSIGFGAFRNCDALKSIAFSGSLTRFDPGWIKGCAKVETIAMPGSMEKMTSAVFDIASLKHLKLGAGLCEIMPGAFGNSHLESIEVSDDNPILCTDGVGIYAKEPCILMAVAVPVEQYDVLPECVAIGRKGFSSFKAIKAVGLPDTLEIVGDFAFTKTSIERFEAPSALRAIGERAFYACPELKYVQLDANLLSIGPNAFSDTAIRELFIPGGVEHLGNPLATGTALTFSGKDATLRIDASDDAKLMLDEHGGLYGRMQDGLHLMRMLEPAATEYAVNDETVAIDDDAFAKHPSIEKVALPEGLRKIGNRAFKDCRMLAEVDLPSTVEELGDEAFLDTGLMELRIPATLKRIGSIALITYGAHHGDVEPSLRSMSVDPANERFYIESGLLIEHLDNGKDRIILCLGSEPNIVVPESVASIAPYAFNGVRRIKSLTLNDGIQAIDVRGLAFDCLVDNIHVDLREPIEGRMSFDFEFPKTTRGAHQMGNAFGSCNFVNIESIFHNYDNSIVHRSGFDAGSDDSTLEAYDQIVRIIARLSDPVYLTPTNRGLMESAIASHLDEFCIEAAKRDDREIMNGLIEFGFIDDGNIDHVIDVVGRLKDASITNFLLEQKRQRWDSGAIDFEL